MANPTPCPFTQQTPPATQRSSSMHRLELPLDKTYRALYSHPPQDPTTARPGPPIFAQQATLIEVPQLPRPAQASLVQYADFAPQELTALEIMPPRQPCKATASWGVCDPSWFFGVIAFGILFGLMRPPRVRNGHAGVPGPPPPPQVQPADVEMAPAGRPANRPRRHRLAPPDEGYETDREDN